MLLDGSGGAVEGAGDVGLREVRQVAEHDDLALTARELAQSAVKIDSLGVGPGVGAVVPGVEGGETPSLAPAPDRQVPGDPDDPRLGVAADLPPPGERAGERLLGDVLGLGANPEQLVADGIRATEEVVERLLEGEIQARGGDARVERALEGLLDPVRAHARFVHDQYPCCHEEDTRGQGIRLTAGGRFVGSPVVSGPGSSSERAMSNQPCDLFAGAAERRLEAGAPLAARMRPRSLDEVVGQAHLLGPGKPLRALIEGDRLSSVILWGPPGTGKTTIARLIAGETSKAFEPLSAVSAGVKDVRDVAQRARARLGEHGQGTILFLDEVHRFNKAQQDALLPHVEEGLIVLVGATTENPFFSLTGPLLSRSTLFRLEPLASDDIAELLDRALADDERGLAGVAIDADARRHLALKAEGDARHALTSLEVAAGLARDAGEPVNLADAEAALAMRAMRYGDDEHYDVISAFIKSVRGSDADAGLYWLARMIEAGEDPRFIARRLVILASEDVGLADPTSLLVADAAARAVEFVGMPEARLNLAQAVVHLARAPKSNSVYTALGEALADVHDRELGAVPAHLRDASYRGAKQLGHGEGYLCPHDAPGGQVDQVYRPPEVAGRRYYKPSGRGRDVAPDGADDPGAADTDVGDEEEGKG